MNCRLFSFIVFFFILQECIAQNLVPNSSFEQHITCPYTISNIDAAKDWFNPSMHLTGGSPDYYHACATYPGVSVPDNNVSHQYAHGGNAYVGIYLWHYFFSGLREYVEVKLISTLKNNTCYHLEMYVNLTDHCKYTTHAIGAYFSDTMIAGIQNYLPLPFTPQIANTLINVFDTASWVKVEGDFIANGGERYLIVGNFEPDSLSNAHLINSFGTDNLVYCFVDDITLIECGTTSINNQSSEEIRVFYNDITSELSIDAQKSNFYEILIYDILSHKMKQELILGNGVIDLSILETGIYIYCIQNSIGISKTGKIFIRN